MKAKIAVVLLILLVVIFGASVAQAHPGVCDDPYPNRITAHDIACKHHNGGHHQYRNGQGTEHHIWDVYRYEAAVLKNYLRALAIARYAAAVRASQSGLVDRWSGVAQCESGGNWSINTGNGYYGGLQFSLSTWRAYGGVGMPHEQSAYYQSSIAERLRTQSGLHHWPNCGRYYG